MKRIAVYVIWAALCVMALCVNVKAATPRVMIYDYSIKEGKVVAGKEFNLQVKLKNTATRAVKNVKLTLTSENGELLPAKGAGTAYISEIAAESEEKFSFPMQAIHGLTEKSYKLSLKTEYENASGYEYSVEESIFIPVTLEQRVSVTDIMIPDEEIQLGDSVEITASINNLGDGTLYNVCAKVSGYNISEQESYIGNVESGKSGTVDVLTKAAALYKQGEKNTITISYEDQQGKVMEKEFLIRLYDDMGGIEVIAPRYSDLEQVKTGTSKVETVKTAVWVVVLIAVIIMMVLLFIRKKKRKQEILDKF